MTATRSRSTKRTRVKKRSPAKRAVCSTKIKKDSSLLPASSFKKAKEWLRYFNKQAKNGLLVMHRDDKSVGRINRWTGSKIFKVKWHSGSKANQTTFCGPEKCDFPQSGSGAEAKCSTPARKNSKRSKGSPQKGTPTKAKPTKKNPIKSKSCSKKKKLSALKAAKRPVKKARMREQESDNGSARNENHEMGTHETNTIDEIKTREDENTSSSGPELCNINTQEESDEEEDVSVLYIDDIWQEKPHDPRHCATNRRGFYLVNSTTRDPSGFTTKWNKEGVPQGKCAGMLRSGFAQLYPGETRAHVIARELAYQKSVSKIRHVIDEVVEKRQSETFKELQHWILYERYGSEDMLVNYRELPVAVVVAGFNTADHRSSFHTLKRHLASSFEGESPVHHEGSFVATLNPSSATNPNDAVALMVQQLVKQGHASSDKSRLRTRGSLSRMHIQDARYLTSKEKEQPLTTLREWYEEIDEDRKYMTTSDGITRTRKIILILEEVEGFDNRMLNYLIYVLAVHTEGLPFVVVLATATGSPSLSPANQRHLCIEHFSMPKPKDVFDEIFERLFYNGECPIHLAPESVRFLQQDYLERTASVSGFMQAASAVLLSHFDKQGLSHIASMKLVLKRDSAKNKKKRGSEDSDDEEEAHFITKSDFNFIQTLPSVQKQKTSNRSKLFEHVQKWIAELREYRTRFSTAFSLIWQTAEKLLPSLNSNVDTDAVRRHVYYQVQSYNIDEVKELSPVFKAIMGLPESNLRDLISGWKQWTEFLKTDSALSSEVGKLLKQFNGMLKEIETAKKEARSSGEHVASSNSRRIANPVKRRRFLMQVAMATQKKRQVVNKKASDFLKNFCAKFLPPLPSLPLHELFVFSSTPNVASTSQLVSRTSTERGIAGFQLRTHMLDYRPRQAIRKALMDSKSYLLKSSKEMGSGKKGTLSSKMEDVCLGHGILREMGKNVNLYDWYQAFAAVHGQKFSAKELQARFTQASNELQFIGLIRPSTRKIDHVQQLFHC